VLGAIEVGASVLAVVGLGAASWLFIQWRASKRAQARALQSAQEQARSYHAAVPGFMVRLTRLGTVLDLKPGEGLCTEGGQGEFTGKHLSEALPPDLAQQVGQAVETALQSGTETPLTGLVAGGRTYEGRITLAGEGEAICTLRDITVQAQREDALRRWEALAAALRRVVPDRVLHVSADGTAKEWPLAGAGDLAPGGETASRPLSELLPVEAAQQLLAAVQSTSPAEDSRVITLSLPDGTRLECRLAPTGRGEALCAMRDVTAEVQKAEAAQSAEALAQALRAAISDMVLRVAPDGTLRDVKPAEGAPLALAAQEVIGRKVHEVLAEEHARQIMTCLARGAQTGTVQVVAYDLPDGSRFRARVVASATGEAVCILSDASQEKRMEETLARQAAHLARAVAAEMEERRLQELRNENAQLRTDLMQIAQVILRTLPAALIGEQPAPPATPPAPQPPAPAPVEPRDANGTASPGAQPSVASPSVQPAPASGAAAPAMASTEAVIELAGDPALLDRIFLVVAPFQNFADVNRFLGSLRKAPGIRDVRVRWFRKGTLSVAVEHDDVELLQEALQNLEGFHCRIAGVENGTVRVTLGLTAPAEKQTSG